MPSIAFRHLVELTAGAIAQIPSSYDIPPETLAELLAEQSLTSLPPGSTLPHFDLDEITIDIPVHFQVSSGHAGVVSSAQLMTRLPSPLVPSSANALSHFSMTLTFYPGV